jgi:hypothetical protein
LPFSLSSVLRLQNSGNMKTWVPWWLGHPPVGHCDTLTRTIRHCSNSPHVMLRPCNTTSAIWWESGFFIQGYFIGAWLSL